MVVHFYSLWLHYSWLIFLFFAYQFEINTSFLLNNVVILPNYMVIHWQIILLVDDVYSRLTKDSVVNDGFLRNKIILSR